MEDEFFTARLALTNARGEFDAEALKAAIRRGDAGAVEEAGGLPAHAVAALMREFRGHRELARRLRSFADTADGSRIAFGRGADAGSLLRTAPDGTVRRIDLDDPYDDLLED